MQTTPQMGSNLPGRSGEGAGKMVTNTEVNTGIDNYSDSSGATPVSKKPKYAKVQPHPHYKKGV